MEYGELFSLCTDNFLWTVKFNVKHRTAANKLLKWRMEQLYDRNSAEMRFYGDTFNSDVKRCRQKIAAEEFSASSDIQNASLELCAAAKDISDVWESYRQGGIGYKTFYRDLLNKEAAFEKKRSEVIKARWDYLYAYSKGSRGYAVSSMIYDGVPASALKPLAESGINGGSYSQITVSVVPK